jgi:hypothetical protein
MKHFAGCHLNLKFVAFGSPTPSPDFHGVAPGSNFKMHRSAAVHIATPDAVDEDPPTKAQDPQNLTVTDYLDYRWIVW